MADQELVHTIEIAAPIDAVWAEITRLDGRQRAMMDTILKATLEAGAPLYYRSPDGKRVFIAGRIVAVEPPRRLSHTWRLLTRDDPWTLVTWELTETAAGTTVTLRHTGWPDDPKAIRGVDGTWRMILPELKRLVETGDISTGLKARYVLMRAFMWALPARTRTENVPEPA
ncbi:MAG TPA: SRPBCC domain-containing protein [Actinophytocola sp.]|uniref:SRPBCC domain-containing protein n=1 Tax=Actinophytocola sp. TaxID=1872138 RepID=UPI002DB74053|nr:SRPBCC domain-containing protein [Actinophytocola sp.]HEU5473025.1 SRPBCC domain-containing protein [Actinophytocola sp.]